jgi:cytoskeletal protein CcmA (bactofilin family)
LAATSLPSICGRGASAVPLHFGRGAIFVAYCPSGALIQSRPPRQHGDGSFQPRSPGRQRNGEVLELSPREALPVECQAEPHWGDFMFTRSSSVEPKVLEPRTTRLNGANTAQSSISAPSTGEKSVIGNDLKIIGQGLRIISRGILQVDGETEGDVLAAEIIVGEKGKVTGMVAGQQVVIRGTVSGVVCGKTVALQASSQIDGDVHHMSFAIEQGALFEGRSRRAKAEADLLAVVEQRPGAQSTNA